MGIGRLGAPNVIIKRKFRWLLEINVPSIGVIPAWYVKTSARPQLEMDELELHYLNAVTWMAGKGKWQPITVVYYDVTDTVMQPLWSWISTVYELLDPATLHQSEPSGYMGSALLTLLDGCGNTVETWQLLNVWPHTINFGELDYAQAEELNIELQLRYSGVIYTGICGPTPIEHCTGCTQ
jgi:hypothetical protein